MTKCQSFYAELNLGKNEGKKNGIKAQLNFVKNESKMMHIKGNYEIGCDILAGLPETV